MIDRFHLLKYRVKYLRFRKALTNIGIYRSLIEVQYSTKSFSFLVLRTRLPANPFIRQLPRPVRAATS
jgi:hypothetical protein